MTFTNHFSGLLLLVATYSVGIYLFSSGFLLTRHEVTEKSQCKTENNDNDSHYNNRNNICWNLPHVSKTYKRVVIIIIDALRYDFIEHVPQYNKPLSYQNKLTVFHELVMKKGCSSVRIFRFIADAPTTTMQRIKGMTTGSFPTFFDVSNNFDSSEILEDNLITQISRVANITFLGDDTWVKLFPNIFTNEHPFPSFDVKDLHTVDDGILRHFGSEFERKNWKLMIAHFLGVDHCGHRYGPLHIEMVKKLEQMNRSIQDIIENMEKDDLLLVMGDHGMTHTGDHGGETNDEINSALISYNPAGNFANNIGNQNCISSTVQQIDLVPTLSLIFNTPIPFGNLGMLISDFLPGDSKLDLQQAFRVNAKQVYSFLTAYQDKFSVFSKNEFHDIHLMYNSTTASIEHTEIRNFKDFLARARDMCRRVWAQFNMSNMLEGLFVCSFITIWMFQNGSKQNLKVQFLLFLCSFLILLISSISLMLFLFLISCIWHVHSIQSLIDSKSIKVSFSILFLFIPIMYLSNSYILNEDLVSLYLFSSLIFLFCSQYSIQLISQSIKSKKLHCETNMQLYISTALTFMLLTATRCAYYFLKCRPEQYWCYNLETIINEASDSISDDNEMFTTRFVWYIFSSGSLMLILAIQTWSIWPNMISYDLLFKQILVCMSSLFTIFYWWTTYYKSDDSFNLVFIPRCSFLFSLLSILSWAIFPLTRTRERDTVKQKSREKISQAFVSNSLLYLCTTILLLISILLGPYYAPVLLAYTVSIITLLELICTFKLSNLDATVLWTMSSSFWWFATGHQNTFSNLPWDSAFIGFQGSHENVIVPALLVSINVFSSQIIHTVSLPLITFWPFRKQIDKQDLKFVQSQEFWPIIQDLYLKYISVQSVKLIGTMIACCIHRRHLMVWAIFAPRFMYEAVSFLIVCVTSLLMFILFSRLRSSLLIRKDRYCCFALHYMRFK